MPLFERLPSAGTWDSDFSGAFIANAAAEDRHAVPPRFMTATEVAGHARVHLQTVYRHLRTGQLRGERAGSGWRITPEAFEEYVAVQGPAESAGRTPVSKARLTGNGRGPLRALLDDEDRGG
jgi:excisionase family DNA binding protein